MPDLAKFSVATARRILTAVRDVENARNGKKVLKGTEGLERRPPQQLFAVRVTIDSGSAGSVSASCTWTYTVTSDAGFEYGTMLTPQKCRLPNVPYVETPAGSWGAGFFDKNGVFVLWDANECPEVEDPCEEGGGEGGGAGDEVFVVENRTSDPSSPEVGQIWLRTDL